MLDTRTFVGVDVAKGHLDVAFPSAKVWRTTNDPAGIAALGRRLAKLDAPHLVCEATGGYTRQLTRALAIRGVAVSRVNPRQVRDFGHRPKFILSDAAGGVEGLGPQGSWPSTS